MHVICLDVNWIKDGDVQTVVLDEYPNITHCFVTAPSFFSVPIENAEKLVELEAQSVVQRLIGAFSAFRWIFSDLQIQVNGTKVQSLLFVYETYVVDDLLC